MKKNLSQKKPASGPSAHALGLQDPADARSGPQDGRLFAASGPKKIYKKPRLISHGKLSNIVSLVH